MPFNLNDVSGEQRHMLGTFIRVNDDSGWGVIAQIDEQQPAVIALAVNPARETSLAADFGERQGGAGVRTGPAPAAVAWPGP